MTNLSVSITSSTLPCLSISIVSSVERESDQAFGSHRLSHRVLLLKDWLTYLHHDCIPRTIHRDVKSSNILLDKDFEAHLTDFGIAKSLSVSKTHTSTYIMGTIGYIDPEYALTSRLNEKSDVYSYGIVLLELLTGKKAVDDESNLHQLILSKPATNRVMETVDPEISGSCMDLEVVKKAFQLALLCTKRQASDRPKMHEVARVLGPPHAAGQFTRAGASATTSNSSKLHGRRIHKT
ncbi:LRR receptor-like serine/threonine-protein kinase ERECTA [Cinnamomum micranthum f. kanehirae]|uniref:LRR receptor-like serine/threonine-protein kinase ERECTA n=1 Tax=Cinnamomum micranthum f. kanehirae TaxID=337451 RepID=A0A3S3M150_9MAGN|nr:LRR receptor-like serine/threonine-protein kinase ERECTA [Cinnamomum micranthum f. kanehirae]